MKAIDKTIGRLIVGCVLACCLPLFIPHTFAVDDLQISVQATNVVLTWPSITGEIYVVQYRRTLNPSDMWVTLSPNWPAVTNADFTSYTNVGIVQYPPATGGGTNDPGNPLPPAPMVKPADGSGVATPLAIYPPGFDLSGLVIFDPATSEWINGDGYSVNSSSASRALSGGVQPLDETDDEDTNQYTGFYRVLNVRLLDGLTNGMTASGYLNVTVRPEATPDYLELQVNGRSFPNQSLLMAPFTNMDSVTFQDVDTAGLSNGVYTLQVEGGWLVPSEESFSSGYELAYSQPVTIYVTNELSYPNWIGYAGDGWTSFHLQSLHPVVDWEIDVYNYYDYLYWYYGYTDTVTPIHVMTGSTTNGLIDCLWNLTDDNGNVRTNLETDPAFFSFTYTSWTNGDGTMGHAFHANGAQPDAGGSGGSAQQANPLAQNDDWPTDGGYWVVAYQDIFRNDYDDGDLMPAMLNGWLDMASAVNPIFYQPPIGGTNAQTFPVRFNGYTNTSPFYDTNSYYETGLLNDRDLLNAMWHDSRARNFYGLGHGSDGRFMSLSQTMAILSSMHRYRFVWLDGCNTAKGAWSSYFGIKESGVMGLDYYQTNHLRPAAFMGHIQEIPYGAPGVVTRNGITYDGTIYQGFPFFRSQFVFYWWLENYSLRNALNEAIFTTPAEVSPIQYVGGPLNGTIYNYGDYLQVNGYDQLGWDDYNDYGDVP